MYYKKWEVMTEISIKRKNSTKKHACYYLDDIIKFENLKGVRAII